MKKLTDYQKRLFDLIAGGVIYTVVMLVGVYVASSLISDGTDKIHIYLGLSIMTMSVTCIYQFITLKPKRILTVIKCLSTFAIYIALGVLSFFAKADPYIYQVIGILFSLMIIYNAILSTIIDHRARKIVLNVIISIFATLLLIIYGLLFSIDAAKVFISFVPLTYVVICFVSAMKLVFSGLRKQTLVQIIKKTYTIEILYGLITLIVATSIMMIVVEDETFANFGDALWYCFAVVTTIGFGDFAATSVIGRLLTVILGIYGLIVVALITSIIVNFYNESSSSKDEKINEIVEQLDESRKKEEPKEEKEEDK